MEKNYVKGRPYFTDINNIDKQYPYLTENIDTNVLIIGGGVTGAICSYYFSKENIKTVLIEKGRIAHLSTSVTTSLLQYELDDTLDSLKSVIGLENAVKAYKLDIQALNEIESIINEYGNNCNYYKRDTIFYSLKEDDEKIIKGEYKLRKENGLDVELLNKDNNEYEIPLKWGVLAKKGGAEIDPYKFTLQLLKASENNGLKVYENTEAIEIHKFNDYIEVECKYGYKIKAKKVIVATGFNTSLITKKHFATKYNTFNIVTKPLKEVPWKNNVLFRDTGDPYTYLRTTWDNRIIIGGEDIDFKDIENEEKAKEKYEILETKLKSMLPNTRDIEIEYKYCGCFASTKDNLGFIGPDKRNNNLLYCLGYGANGILFAIIGAKILVDLYKGKENSDLELFKVDRFDK
ncbi:NAD(P)/FAD-dependent oxidoreductase [Clostridium sp.]|uniref:NAD(P)/FAD-dependent oxidoreductase n=1 Tax=Clostridium sp. TaxID=1506 RepID=UPI003F2C6975